MCQRLLRRMTSLPVIVALRSLHPSGSATSAEPHPRPSSEDIVQGRAEREPSALARDDGAGEAIGSRPRGSRLLLGGRLVPAVEPVLELLGALLRLHRAVDDV